ncbi:MAG: RagB/SusD family nutrient uptake outer membrane protein [Duncaniella sp.]|nr:RagB/SusD family nutrient uptake outer membrane protein [Muribaculum sp.]MCM1254797.1 RagB/SusD family nutrient uptake outer membrane protein [Duncaniella sp.]
MNKYIKCAFALSLSTVALTSCDDYLDTMPDNRATLDSEEKIKNILVSAYPDHDYCLVAELSSDNVDDFAPKFNKTIRWVDDAYAWKDESESNNESLNSFWETSYVCIASTNEAIAAINELGGPDKSTNLSELMGEALVCRAYNHFMLANMFCMAWTQNAAQDLGLPYMEHPETELQPKYERGNLADFYTKIQEDLEEGLTRISDSYYTVPKYHFNVKAAWAFATRFYLYTEQWEKAVQAANKCLGSQPAVMLRDWAYVATMPQDVQAICNEYVNANSNCNLLMFTAYSSLGLYMSNYSSMNRFNHGQYLASNEDILAVNIFGDSNSFYHTPKRYTGSMDRVIFWKCPNMFEYTDLVAGIGYRRCVYPAFTADETLLNRAEAYIMLRKYDEAAADLTMWSKNISKSTLDLTPDNITEFYKDRGYCYDDAQGLESAMKKHLHPAFAIDGEGSTQESMLQCMLAFRRIETLQLGLRWFDIKRYGIEIPRRVMDASGYPIEKTDFLAKDDLRRMFQIPQKVRDAEFEPNPR